LSKGERKKKAKDNGETMSQSTMVQPLDTIDEIAELVGERVKPK